MADASRARRRRGTDVLAAVVLALLLAPAVALLVLALTAAPLVLWGVRLSEVVLLCVAAVWSIVVLTALS